MPKLGLLTRDDIILVSTASLEVLEKSGIMVKNQRALKVLGEAGCDVESQVVHFPSDLVEESIKKAPSKIELHGRDGDGGRTVGGDNVVYNPGSSAIYFLDGDTGEMRRASSRDLLQLVRLVDALEHIQAQSCLLYTSDAADE